MIDNNCVLSAEQLEDLEGDFWERRWYLKTIWQEAFNSIASPWAVLGDVMVRVQLSVPSDVVLPRIRGGQASTTLYVTIVSDSGGGKTSADALVGRRPAAVRGDRRGRSLCLWAVHRR